MSRVLVAVLPGDEAVALASLTTVTRAAPRARIRVACFRPLPPARRDRHDRVAADTDAEMDRIGRAAVAGFDAAARDLEHAGLEIVVRFGAPAREAAVEAEVYDADLAVLFAPPPGAPVPGPHVVAAPGARRTRARADARGRHATRGRRPTAPDAGGRNLLNDHRG